MGYINLLITGNSYLKIKNEQLIAEGNDHSQTFPLEDLNSVVIENTRVSVSAFALQKFCEHAVAVYVCDGKHIPNGVLIPFERHSRHLSVLKKQISLVKPKQKRLWQQLVIKKLENQAECLQLLDRDGAGELRAMSRQVGSGDPDNVEARAAAKYFRLLFPENPARGAENFHNAALNYGYAIIRGLLARSLVCYGFEPSLGLFHHSELNNFNLADDLIEPFRPLVDLFVAENFSDVDEDSGLQPEHKRLLCELPTLDIEIDGGRHSVSNAADKTAKGLSTCICGDGDTLSLPSLLPVGRHEYE